MKTRVRPRTLVSPLLTELLEGKRRELVVDPEGSFFEIKDLASALKKAGTGDVIILPPGEYPAFELTRSVEICAAQPGTVTIRGTSRIAASQAILRGLSFQADTPQPAITCDKGLFVIDDCIVAGRIEVGGKARLFVRNSLLGRANDAILLKDQASAELLTSRISGSRIGVALRAGTSVALYHSAIDGCTSGNDSDPGAGIFAEKASVYCEGVHFSANDVALYLLECGEAAVVASHFQASRVASLIAAGGSAQLSGCTVNDQPAGLCAQISLSGGKWEILHSTFATSPAPALAADQAQIEVTQSSFVADGTAAIDLRSTHITGEAIKCQSLLTAALAATQCQGTLRDSSFAGTPSLELVDSPALNFENCDSEVLNSAISSAEADGSLPSTIETILEKLRKSVGQEAARNELERLLRLVQDERSRESGEFHLHSVFMGASGTGRLEAARQFAEGLHILGQIDRPEVTEILSFGGLEEPPAETGVFLVRIRQAGSASGSEGMVSYLEKLIMQPGQVVILAGERDEVRRLLRSSPVLDRMFRRTLFFSTYGPAELASVFAQYCERDHIPLSPEAAQALLLSFHLYSERKDKRFANITGVKALYESTRHRYLERSSATQGADLPLAPVDLEIPADKAIRNAVERSPAFVAFCPDCKKENPWLPGLLQPSACLHCGASYTAPWGIWRDSSIFRRMSDSLNQVPNTNLAARRTHLPSR